MSGVEIESAKSFFVAAQLFMILAGFLFVRAGIFASMEAVSLFPNYEFLGIALVFISIIFWTIGFYWLRRQIHKTP